MSNIIIIASIAAMFFIAEIAIVTLIVTRAIYMLRNNVDPIKAVTFEGKMNRSYENQKKREQLLELG